MAEAAVEIRDALKSYVNETIVLNHMNMTVPRGMIYGLLGASGSGKTSILEVIVGLRQLDSGRVKVFGKAPGNGWPGRRLGYMPQDVALYPYFTIREILLYFGRIYGMEKSDILKREEFLTKFLQLPASSKRISSLSGGQQRRTSLATAFVHDPDLLILDEPTVGLDPLLRNNIWEHLCQVVKNGRTTVIVTTHYTEEIRRSNMIGLMRYGRLLAEDSPANLLQLFNTPFMEDIVLELCRRDHEGNKLRNQSNNNEAKSGIKGHSFLSRYALTSLYPRPISRIFGSRKGSLFSTVPFSPRRSSADFVAESQNCDCVVVGFTNIKSEEPHKVQILTSAHEEESKDLSKNDEDNAPLNPSSVAKRVQSIVRRNCIFFLRNLWFFFILLIYPAFQAPMVATVIGGDPKNLTLGVVNDEVPDWMNVCRTVNLSSCEGQFSCRFLKRLETDNFKLIPFLTNEEAMEQAHLGSLYGILTIPTNYTQHTIDRTLAANYALNESLDGTTIRVQLDYSNFVPRVLITRQLYLSLEKYGMELGGDCGKFPKEFEIPLEYKKAIYGRLEANYNEYVAPGALVIVLFLVPLATCGLGFVADKRQGTMDRSMAAGVTTFEMMISFFVTDGFMIILQTMISTTILVYGWDFRIEGSYLLYGAICFLTGLTGQSWGFILGIICPNEWTLLITGFSLHFPLLIQGGIIWPLEGIPITVKYISQCLPVTASLNSLRSIISRGVGITHIGVWPGFVILTIWIISAWCFAVVKYKSFRK